MTHSNPTHGNRPARTTPNTAQVRADCQAILADTIHNDPAAIRDAARRLMQCGTSQDLQIARRFLDFGLRA